MARHRYTQRNNPQSGNQSVKPGRASEDRHRHWRIVGETAYRTPELRHCVRLVDELGRIHGRHPTSAGVWPKQSTLADLLDRDVSVIKRQLRALAAHGLVVKTVRQAYPDPDNEGRLVRPANYYRPNLPRCRQLRDEHRERILARARRHKEQAVAARAAGHTYGASTPPQSPLRGEVTPGAVPTGTPPPPEWASTSPDWVHSPPTDAGRHAMREARAQLRGKRC